MSSFESEKSTLNETDYEVSINYENLISQIARLINKIINKNEEKDEYLKYVMDQSHLFFHSNYLPNISFEDYMFRIRHYSQIEDSILIYALIYVDKLITKGIFISQYNIYRIFLSCIFISCKLYDDKKYNLNIMSKIGGVTELELFNLEYEFCSLLNFQLYINDNIYYQYQDFLLSEINKNKFDDLYEG